MTAKELAAEKCVEFVEDEMMVALGSGSTMRIALVALGRRVREGLRIRSVATSEAIRALAESEGIAVGARPESGDVIDLCIDGADEIDPEGYMIKGGGGALFREKVCGYAAKKYVIVVDDTKLVERLGAYPVPLEVLPYAERLVYEMITKRYGVEPVLRLRDGGPYVTDNGNHIIDVPFGVVDDPVGLDHALRAEPGVVETGLFVRGLDVLVVGHADRVELRTDLRRREMDR